MHEYAALLGPLAGYLQGVAAIPFGDQWQIKGSLSHTPTLITDTLPPHPLMAYKVPAGKALLFTGGVMHALTAATEYVRVCRRYFLFGWQVTPAPAAPAAPTVASIVLEGGFGDGAASFTYKVAPIDAFRREGPASAASASVTPGFTDGVTVTPPATGTGVVGYNIYRSLSGVWYYVGTTPGATPFIDAQFNAEIDQTLVPLNNWTTGAIAGETADGPCEVIIEVGPVALNTPPTHMLYKGVSGRTRALAVTFPSTVGQRIRAKLSGETSNFVAVPTATANLWRGPTDASVRSGHEKDFGTTSVVNVNAGPLAGSFMVWGQQVIGASERDEATAGIKSRQIWPTSGQGALIPPGGEIVVEIGALAAGVAAVRDVTLSGLLLPTTGA